MKKTYNYFYITKEVGAYTDRRSLIIIPDFNCQMEFTDGSEYSGIAMERAIAEAKLKSLIWCYKNDNRELPKPSSPEEIITQYHEVPMLMTVDIGEDADTIVLSSEDQFRI